MCGRVDHRLPASSWRLLEQYLGPLQIPPETGQIEVRPTDPLPFLRPVTTGLFTEVGRWGLIPRGMALSEAKQYRTFNARVETLGTKAMFRDAFRHGRCIIPVHSFFEWMRTPAGKVKIRITRRDGRPLLMAGLWSEYETSQGLRESCTIVTRPPTSDLQEIHDRMPALLLTWDIDCWLHAPPHQAQVSAYTSYPAGLLRASK